MPIKSSGAIKISEIASEFGLTPPYKMSTLYKGGANVPNSAANAAVPATGALKTSHFYGATKLVQTPFPSISGLVNRWKFDGTIADSVGNSTNTSSPATPTFYARGIGGQALSGCSVASTLQSTSLTSWSFSFWFKTSSSSYSVVWKSAEGQTSWPYIYINGGKIYFDYAWYNGTAWLYAGHNTPITLNKWTHVAGHGSATGSKFFVNGVLISTSTNVAWQNLGAYPFKFCGDGATVYGSNMISDFCFFNRVLTDAEVTTLYDYRPPIASVTSKGYYYMRAAGDTTTIDLSTLYSAAASNAILFCTVESSPFSNASITGTTLTVTFGANNADYAVAVSATNGIGTSELINVNIIEFDGVARSVSTIAGSLPNLYHRWRFEGNLTDAVGGTTGTGFNVYKTAANSRLGGLALDTSAQTYSGIRLYPSITSATSVTPNGDTNFYAVVSTNPWTIAFFVMPIAAGQNTSLFALYNMASRKVNVTLNSAGNFTFSKGEPNYDWNYTTSNAPSTFNRWSHVALTYDGTKFRAYINGALVSTSGNVACHVWDTVYFAAGGTQNASSTGGFNGLTDELMIFGAALSDADVAALAAANTQ